MKHYTPLTRGPQERFSHKKSPARTGATWAAFLLAKNTQPLQLERVAWLTAGMPITVARPRPICTALPHFPSLLIEISVYGRQERVSMSVPKCREKSAILPVRLALFHQSAHTFLRIFQAIELVQENVHGILQAIAQRQTHTAENGFFRHGEDGTRVATDAGNEFV